LASGVEQHGGKKDVFHSDVILVQIVVKISSCRIIEIKNCQPFKRPKTNHHNQHLVRLDLFTMDGCFISAMWPGSMFPKLRGGINCAKFGIGPRPKGDPGYGLRVMCEISFVLKNMEQ
jgi:hypothetical protein